MIDYTNDGAADPTGYQKLIVNNRNLLLGASSYSIAVWLRRSRSPGFNTLIIGERNATSDNNKGWLLWCNSTYYLSVQHGNGSSYVSCGNPSAALSVDTLYLVVFTWNGSNYQWWRDNGVAWGNGSFSQAIASTAADMTVGADDGEANQAFAGQVGQILVWPNVVLSQTDVQTLYAGTEIPSASDYRFYHDGTTSPGVEEYESEVPTTNGTIYLKSLNPPDDYYSTTQGDQISTSREVFSRELRRRRFPEERYSLQVPLEYLSIELLDGLNISHDSLPRAASLISNIEDDQLMQTWQRMYAKQTVQRLDLNSMTMDISCANAEPYICYAWSTDILKREVTDEYDGLAQIDQGAAWTDSRETQGWVEQEDGRIATVNAGASRITGDGFLPSIGAENKIQNSTFNYVTGGSSYIPNWVQGGSSAFSILAVADSPPLMVDDVTFEYANQIQGESSGTYYWQQDISVASTTLHGIFSCWYRTVYKASTTAGGGWQVLTTDGDYWNDATPAWQSSAVSNLFAESCTYTGYHSNPISISSAMTWRVRVGVFDATTQFSDIIVVGQVQVLPTKYQYQLPPVATLEDNTYTVNTDERYFEFDNNSTEDHRIVAPTRCGTFRCRFTAYNEYDTMDTDDVLTIAYIKFDNAGNNYDLLCYENPSGANHRFAFKRYRHGALDTVAHKDTDISVGTSYELAFRWTWDEFGTSPTANATTYDGSTDYYSLAADLTGNADSKKGTLSAWIRLDGDDASTLTLLHSTGDRFFFRRASSDKFQISAEDDGGTTRLNIRSTSTHTTGSGWIHVLASWDLEAAATHLLINGKDALDEVTADDATIDYTAAAWAVGAQVGGTSKHNGAVGELYFGPGEYFDFDDGDNVALFYRSDHNPEYLGGDGSIPADAQPLIYLPTGAGDNNCGVGGQFTENGTPDTASMPGPHRTLSVFVDGTEGTPEQAKSSHASFDSLELCPDSTCATDFFDSKGTGWSHDSTDDEYDSDGSQSADSDLTEGSICVNGWVYRVEFEVKNCTAGNICAVCGTQEGTDRSSNGVYSEYITANGTDFIIRADANFVGSVTNIYIHKDKYNGFWIGTAPSATGYLPAMNYIANWEIIQRAIPDEEIQARR